MVTTFNYHYIPGLTLQCPDVNMNTQDRVGDDWTSNVKTWEECSDLCQKRNDCKFWTWHHANAGSYAFWCSTMKDAGGKVANTDCVSGGRTCKGNKCVSIIPFDIVSYLFFSFQVQVQS